MRSVVDLPYGHLPLLPSGDAQSVWQAVALYSPQHTSLSEEQCNYGPFASLYYKHLNTKRGKCKIYS